MVVEEATLRDSAHLQARKCQQICLVRYCPLIFVWEQPVGLSLGSRILSFNSTYGRHARTPSVATFFKIVIEYAAEIFGFTPDDFTRYRDAMS